jgi:hypothetical protein
MTAEDAQAQGEQDASAVAANHELYGIRGGGMLTVYPVEDWVPRDHRRAYPGRGAGGGSAPLRARSGGENRLVRPARGPTPAGRRPGS